jgi:gamma-glutamyltranspeptidase/glutathione hydrolase
MPPSLSENAELDGGARGYSRTEASAATAMRPTLSGSRHAIAAGHYLAAAAGFAILEAGGNAVDAGCCAGIALGVVMPYNVNVAGVAPIMIRTAAGQVITLAGLGHWPRNMPSDLFMREHGGKIPPGILRTVIPAAPDAWITALRDHGTMSFGTVADAATRFAREGFSVHEQFASTVATHAEGYRAWPANAAIYLPNGRAPLSGERFVQTDLAATLQYMIDEERAAAGKGREAGLEAARAAFYCGDIAEKIVRYHKAEGGYLTREDLAEFRSRYEAPVQVRWGDVDLYTCGAWCQGPVLAEAVRMVQHAGLGGMRHNSADYIHLLTEILKAAFSDREHRFGDPRFVDVDLDQLLSDAHIAARVAAIDRDVAMPDMPPPIGTYPSNVPEFRRGPATPQADQDTSYVCAVDRWGNAFSATPSDGSWRSPVIPGLGIVPSTRGSQSRPDPNHPNGVAPGKRPRLTPNPAMAVRADGSIFPFGTPGGDVQIQAMLQVFLNVFHFGMEIQQAIEAPRFATWSFPNSFAPHSHFPGRLDVEGRVPASVLDDLRRRGHGITELPPFARAAAAVDAILYERPSGFFRAGADPRQPAYAIAI